MAARYDRALAENAFLLVAPNGPLRFLITDAARAAEDTYAYDIQIRENNTLMYYHGTTRVLSIRLIAALEQPWCKIDAAATYRKLASYRELTMSMGSGSMSRLRQAFSRYLSDVAPRTHMRYYRNRKEGYWQNRLCIDFARHWTADAPWMVIDRECVIGFGDGDEKRSFYESKLKPYMDIRDRLQKQDETKWGRPVAKPLGDELDLLAIDVHGRLLAIELKHGTNPGGIYWGPLQVLAYHDAFAHIIPDVSKGIRDLAKQKVELGLLPLEAGQWIPKDAWKSVQPVLAVAEPNPHSTCWRKLDTVISAVDRAMSVVTQSVRIAEVTEECTGQTAVAARALPPRLLSPQK